MGEKLSKNPNEHFPSQKQISYDNVVRSYAKWDHHSGLTTHDVTRFSSYEIQNFKKHNETFPNSINQEKFILSDNNNNKQIKSQPSLRKKTRLDQNIHGKRLTRQKSQSIEYLPNSQNIITAKQLIKNESLRRQKYTSSFSQNQTKQIPLDLQLVFINQNDLQNVEEIGKGNFGTVYRALYKGTRDVALKTLNSDRENNSHKKNSLIEEYNDKNVSELLHEAYIMTCLEHENLLRIIGVTFFGEDKQLSLITDLMKNGSLLDYLRKSRESFLKSDSKEITLKLNCFAKQIFNAMFYLEERKIIHRDLATRNCLIADDHTLKIGDFGLTKLTDCGLYRGNYRTICAIRWTSPEGIFSLKYTSRSDVWSYGITLWEIYSLGERPYTNLNNKQIKNILKNSSENLSRYLPQSQQFGSDEIYTHIILPCLTYNVLLRPRFKDLYDRVFNILNDNITY